MKTFEVIKQWMDGALANGSVPIHLLESIDSIEDAKMAEKFAIEEGFLEDLERSVSHSRERRILNVFSSAGFFFDIDMDKQLTFWDNKDG